MCKRKFIVTLIILIIFLFSGCITDNDIRPQGEEEYVWICEEPYTYFCWNKDDNDFVGEMKIGGHITEITVEMNPGKRMFFFNRQFLKDERKTAEDATLFIADVEYYKDYFVLKIDDSIDNNIKNTTLIFEKHLKEGE